LRLSCSETGGASGDSGPCQHSATRLEMAATADLASDATGAPSIGAMFSLVETFFSGTGLAGAAGGGAADGAVVADLVAGEGTVLA